LKKREKKFGFRKEMPPSLCQAKRKTKQTTMDNFLNNHIEFRFETAEARNTCINFLRDSLLTYENKIDQAREQGYTTESSGALREAIEMRNAFRKSLSKVFYRTSVKK